eukprot:9518713-Ditylum_brightwellii.AAC.1
MDDSLMRSSMPDADNEEDDFGENETLGILAKEDVEVEEEDVTLVPLSGVFLVDHEEYEDSQ